MPTRLLAVAAVALLAGAVVAYAIMSGPGGPSRPAQVTSGKALVGGSFNLVDHTGKAVTDRDYRGKHLLVFFGFTHCPDVCPAGLQVMAQALEQIGTKAETVTPVFITLDPERDTPNVMGKYVASFHPAIVGLTGTSEQTAAAAKAYRVYAKKVPGDGADYSLDHTSIIYLMDPEGVFIRPFAHGTQADKLTAELNKIL